MCNQEMGVYLQLFDKVMSNHKEVYLYLDGLSSWIRGHLDWCLATYRYQT
jgi:hypothetical protein